MTKALGLMLAACITVICGFSDSASANSLQISPTRLPTTSLVDGEKKQGFVDIVNTSGAPVKIVMLAQRFEQVNNEGTLRYIEDKAVSQAVKFDLDEIILGPNEGYRVLFQVDGTSLPDGANLIAIFANSQEDEAAGNISNQVGAGSLLLVENNGAGEKALRLSSETSFIQFGDGIQSDVKLTNVSSASSSAFYPIISTNLRPFGAEVTNEGPLVTSGITRDYELKRSGDYFGLYRLEVAAGGSSTSAWVFAITGIWRYLAPIFAVTIAMVLYVLFSGRGRGGINRLKHRHFLRS